MNNYCAFGCGHKCLKWQDYQLARLELEETNNLCHGNLVEIQHLREYIDTLRETLRQHGIEIPLEY